MNNKTYNDSHEQYTYMNTEYRIPRDNDGRQRSRCFYFGTNLVNKSEDEYEKRSGRARKKFVYIQRKRREDVSQFCCWTLFFCQEIIFRYCFVLHFYFAS